MWEQKVSQKVRIFFLLLAIIQDEKTPKILTSKDPCKDARARGVNARTRDEMCLFCDLKDFKDYKSLKTFKYPTK